MAVGTARARTAVVRKITPQHVVLFVLFGGFVLYPSLVAPYRADRFTQAIIYAIIGLSVNVLIGYAGQISLGHQAFVGVGAFTAAYMATVVKLPMPLAIAVAAMIGAGTAALLGLVALRIQGLYLALITLAYGTVAERSLFGIQKLTGGGLGQPAERPGYVNGDAAYAYLCMIVLAVLLFIDWRMLKTKFGRALLALKSNEQVASSFGMNPVFYKVSAFVMAGTIAGIGGGLLAFRTERVVAQDFDFAIALTFVIMVVVGGLGSRIGAVIGSMFVSYLPFLLGTLAAFLTRTEERLGLDIQYDFENLVGPLSISIGAILLLLTITRFPGGIAQQLHPLTEWLSGKPFPHHAKAAKTKKTKKPHFKLPGMHKKKGSDAPS